MASGGKRVGAGKPKGYKAPHTLAAQTAKQKAIEMVEAELEAIFQPQIEQAKQGDTPAFTAVLDRAWGKPTQMLLGDPNQPLFGNSLQSLTNEQLEHLSNGGSTGVGKKGTSAS